eukprot:gene6833-9355_t
MLSVDGLFKKGETLAGLFKSISNNWLFQIVTGRKKYKPFIVLIDQFDNFYDENRLYEFGKFVKNTAEKSSKQANFIMVVCVTSSTLAQNLICLNGRQKIRLVGDASKHKWGEDEVDKYLASVKSRFIATEEQIKYCIKAGTPQYCLRLCKTLEHSDYMEIESEAEALANVWISGCDEAKNLRLFILFTLIRQKDFLMLVVL